MFLKWHILAFHLVLFLDLTYGTLSSLCLAFVLESYQKCMRPLPLKRDQSPLGKLFTCLMSTVCYLCFSVWCMFWLGMRCKFVILSVVFYGFMVTS